MVIRFVFHHLLSTYIFWQPLIRVAESVSLLRREAIRTGLRHLLRCGKASFGHSQWNRTQPCWTVHSARHWLAHRGLGNSISGNRGTNKWVGRLSIILHSVNFVQLEYNNLCCSKQCCGLICWTSTSLYCCCWYSSQGVSCKDSVQFLGLVHTILCKSTLSLIVFTLVRKSW